MTLFLLHHSAHTLVFLTLRGSGGVKLLSQTDLGQIPMSLLSAS